MWRGCPLQAVMLKTLPIVCDCAWSPLTPDWSSDRFLLCLWAISAPGEQTEVSFSLSVTVKAGLLMCCHFLTCCLSTACSLFSKPWRSEVTCFRSSFSRFMITCTFSWASRHSLPWARLCPDLWVCGSGARGLVVTSSWAESSCRDETFCWDSSSSCLTCCESIRGTDFKTTAQTQEFMNE